MSSTLAVLVGDHAAAKKGFILIADILKCDKATLAKIGMDGMISRARAVDGLRRALT